jgi:hypothetical protein
MYHRLISQTLRGTTVQCRLSHRCKSILDRPVGLEFTNITRCSSSAMKQQKSGRDAKSLEKPDDGNDWKIIKKLGVYIWPSGDSGTKVRIMGALSLLLGGKLLNIQVPMLFKDIVDGLALTSETSSELSVAVVALLLGCTYNSFIHPPSRYL